MNQSSSRIAGEARRTRTGFACRRPGGTLALIQYFGLKEQRSVDDQEA
jgi:hypothetical protein